MSKKILLSFCLLVTACATTTGPVVIRDVNDLPRSPAIVSSQTDSGQQKSTSNAVRPISPTVISKASQSPFKQQLLERAQQRLALDDPKGAIVIAERGLRVDRREPKFYEMLARAYNDLGNAQQSVHFAQQGLRYTAKGSEQYRRLQAWIPHSSQQQSE